MRVLPQMSRFILWFGDVGIEKRGYLQLYEYDGDSVYLIQPSIAVDVHAGKLSPNYLVFSEMFLNRSKKQGGVSVYRREQESNQPFSFLQRLDDVYTAGGSDLYSFDTIAVDENILVARGVNHMHIFVE